MIISSVSNEKIKYIKKLRDSKFSFSEKTFIVEGEHLVEEAKNCKILKETISIEDCNYGVLNTKVTSNVMKSISSLLSIPKVIGICCYIKEKEDLGDKIIILDGVQDPGNLGTIIRSANAFGFDSVVLAPSCVKKYNDKVIRATQGMLFKMNIVTKNIEEFIPVLIKNGYDVYATSVTNGIDVKEVKKKNKIAIIMGSEGSGVSENVKKMVSKNLYIKMSDTCESLNVAVASSILMYELQNKE